MKGTRRVYKKQLKLAEKELDSVYKYYFQANSLAVQLDLENSTIKNELQYLKNKISECKITNDSLAHTASMLVRIEVLNKTISSLNDKIQKSKNYLGRIYWPSTKYCTIKQQPIL